MVANITSKPVQIAQLHSNANNFANIDKYAFLNIAGILPILDLRSHFKIKDLDSLIRLVEFTVNEDETIIQLKTRQIDVRTSVNFKLKRVSIRHFWVSNLYFSLQLGVKMIKECAENCVAYGFISLVLEAHGNLETISCFNSYILANLCGFHTAIAYEDNYNRVLISKIIQRQAFDRSVLSHKQAFDKYVELVICFDHNHHGQFDLSCNSSSFKILAITSDWLERIKENYFEKVLKKIKSTEYPKR